MSADRRLHTGTVCRSGRAGYGDAERASGAGVTDVRTGEIAAGRFGWGLQSDILSMGFVIIWQPRGLCAQVWRSLELLASIQAQLRHMRGCGDRSGAATLHAE